MAKRTTRRDFLKSSAGAGVSAAFLGSNLGYWVSGRGAWAAEAASDQKLNVAFVGVANRAAEDVRGVTAAGVNVVAMCDADDLYLTNALKNFPQAKRYNDFRLMLETEKTVDAVVVATPDHIHVPASLMAINLGKHVYCEKPLAHNVYEARICAEAAKNKKRVTQLGTQIHEGSNYRRVVELVQSGAIGAIKECHVFIDKGMWTAGDRPTGTPPVPKNLHYDLWLGPAAEWAYHPAYLPGSWRKYWNFGNGNLGDMACHFMDLPFWALSLRHPTKISAEGPPAHPDGCPAWLIITYEFPERPAPDGKILPPVMLTWSDADKLSPDTRKKYDIPNDWRNGVLFVGENGKTLLADYSRHMLMPAKDFQDFKPPAPTIPESIGHHKEWVEACKKNDPSLTTCNFDYSGALTEAVLLGCVAHRVGKPLEWDAKALKATNAPEAEKFLKREYRRGWELPVIA